MGSAAAYHLAARGLRVLGLERFALGHELGSSHGLTRIIRLAYFEHPAYVPLLRRAFELWRELEAAAGERLLHVTGAIDAGADGSRVLEGSLRSCVEHALRYELLDAAALHRRFPAWRVPPAINAVLQPDGGFLVPERCIAAHASRAIAAGADIHTSEQVLNWDVSGSVVHVRTNVRSYDAGQIVLTSGAWMGTLASSLTGVLTPERQVLGWFATADPARFTPAVFPVFILDVEEGIFYGFPEFDVSGLKIGRYHHRGERVDPESVDRTCHPRDEAILRAAIARYLPSANGALLKSTVCLFTNTPDEHFIIDRNPAVPEALLVSPCSGHGFKFSSVIGEIVADLVQRNSTRHDISLFNVDRFSKPRE